VDIVIFPLVRRSHEGRAPGDAYAVLAREARGLVVTRIDVANHTHAWVRLEHACEAPRRTLRAIGHHDHARV
jgi:hypothetical protein